MDGGGQYIFIFAIGMFLTDSRVIWRKSEVAPC